MSDCLKDEMSEFVDSSERIEDLHQIACRQNVHITLFCGGPFSGKHRCGREFARKLAGTANPSYCLQIDLPFRLKYSPEESIEISMIKFVVKEMKKNELFEKDIDEICQNNFNPEVFLDFFSKKKQKCSKFIFVFDDADIVVMKNKQDGFLTTLKTWTEKCKNVFVVLTTQFQFKLYRDCLTYDCKPLETEDAVIFLKNEIKRINLSPSLNIEVPTLEECTKLVELVYCWPFLVMVVAHELEDYSANEIIELLTTTPLLTLSNEAASQMDQLDYKLEHMLKLLSDKLKKETSFFAPDVKQFFTVDEVIKVSQYKSITEAKQTLKPLRIRSIVRKTDGVNEYAFIDFMKVHIDDNALDNFQPSTFKNTFVRMIGELVLQFLRNTVKCNDEERKSRQQAATELKAMLDQMEEFVNKAKHSEHEDLKDCDFEKVIEAAETFLYRATRQNDPEFRKKADEAKKVFGKDTQRRDSNESGTFSGEEEERVATVTPVFECEHNDAQASVPGSVGPCSLTSNADIENVPNPLLLQQIGGYQQQQSRSSHGPQVSTALFRQDVDALINISQETSIGNSREGHVVPSGYNSIPLKETITRH
ncbi:uncharacterized protein LOC117124949 [Anneissia japonica]|uniref:uncharacterized protein LOC117124949 n=1 Tax=Anneissia japonica TaxID=1529436 RepID=UPI001425959A|nr:uncharacterized protein LOC117124949 [Anneissia japonica]XP_033127182.1 uncharacterized protein LOC117124949 [Anneissia japonica]XP_033127183.1 uncharacterized protein LOC117124949 [Anneissia japonica]XP_033127184.1 uncharacterized protein LOC117124949 [Anneissia japonica]